jgi:hypothetical protein
MQKIKMSLAAFAIAAAALVSFKNPPSSSIKGKVSPANYAVHAWAISENDTLYTTINKGSFEFVNAQPGTYRIVVEAISPYRHLAKDGIVVGPAQEADIELSLQKY